MLERSVRYFVIGVIAPAVLAYVVFVYAELSGLRAGPEEYRRQLTSAGALDWTIPLARWKPSLATDIRCAAASGIVIGSSRLVEVDRWVLGQTTDICNLSIDGLDIAMLRAISRALPPREGDATGIIYLGLDHFLFWYRNPDHVFLDTDARSFGRQLLMPLTLLSPRSVWFASQEYWRRLTARRKPFDAQDVLWYPDGHSFQPRYYAGKAQRRAEPATGMHVSAAMAATFPAWAAVDDAAVRTFGESLDAFRRLGYRVHLFWNPLAPAYLDRARKSAALFNGAIAAVEEIVATGRVEWYAGSGTKLDASSVGCTDNDYMDAVHADVDCLARFASAVLGAPVSRSEPVSRVILDVRRREYQARTAP